MAAASHRKLQEEKALEMMMLSLLTYMLSTSFKRNSILNQQTRVPSINTHLMQKAIMVSNIKMKAASFIGSILFRWGNQGNIIFIVMYLDKETLCSIGVRLNDLEVMKAASKTTSKETKFY